MLARSGSWARSVKQPNGAREVMLPIGPYPHSNVVFGPPYPLPSLIGNAYGGHIHGGRLASCPLAASKGRDLWMTEHLVVDTIWSGAFATAKEINDCMVAGMNAYVWWYIRRFCGPIDDNSNVTRRGYVMSQYARFVRPGFTRVSAAATPRTNVSVTAYEDGCTVVIVALESGSSSIDQMFTIPNGTATTFTPHVTSSTKNCVQGSAISVSHGTFSATLDPSRVTTLASN
jgi:glucuronoarabinoxylan endo-1,4-beta-xylanase